MQKYLYATLFILILYGCNEINTTNNLSLLKDKPIEDNQILELVLTQDYKDGGFTVVEPQSSTGMGGFDERSSGYIFNGLKESGVPPDVLEKLISTFIHKNKEIVTLTLESKPEKGYLVDYEGKFSNYFKLEKAGGWEQWRKENPKAHCSTSVSLPAYNKEHELILIYVGQQCDWLAGMGRIVLFKNASEKPQELGSMMLWVS